MAKKFQFNDGSTFEARNYYGVLGLKVGRHGESGINKAYKKLALKYHPDKIAQSGISKEEADRKMREINEAKDILLAHENELRNLLLRGEGQYIHSKFECAGCHSQSELLFKEHVEGNGTRTKYCNYFCLPDCANELEGKLACESKFGKCCGEKIIKSKKYGNVCSESCLNKLKNGEEELKKWTNCIKCGKQWKDGEEWYTTSVGIICLACSGKERQNWKCFWCKGGVCEKNKEGKFVVWNPVEDPSKEFCTQKCIKEWRKSLGRDSEKLEKEDFIANKLKTLTGWNLLSKEEKQNFINQINNSEPKQFENILQQAKKLIKEKQKTKGGEGRGGNNNSGNNSGDNSDSGYDSDDNQSLTNIQELAKSQTQAEQQIEKLLKENGVSEQELSQEGILEGTDWKSYLKKLDTPQKVAEFMEKMQQTIMALKAKKLSESSSNKGKEPKSDKILPVIILVVSFLALTSLVLMVRKRRQRRF